jgi:hypothetical protein
MQVAPAVLHRNRLSSYLEMSCTRHRGAVNRVLIRSHDVCGRVQSACNFSHHRLFALWITSLKRVMQTENATRHDVAGRVRTLAPSVPADVRRCAVAIAVFHVDTNNAFVRMTEQEEARVDVTPSSPPRSATARCCSRGCTVGHARRHARCGARVGAPDQRAEGTGERARGSVRRRLSSR